jgi:hypothetical protein
MFKKIILLIPLLVIFNCKLLHSQEDNDQDRFDYQYELIFFKQNEFLLENSLERFESMQPINRLGQSLSAPLTINLKSYQKRILRDMSQIVKSKGDIFIDDYIYSDFVNSCEAFMDCESEAILSASQLPSPIPQTTEERLDDLLIYHSPDLLLPELNRLNVLRPYEVIGAIGWYLDIDARNSDFLLEDLQMIHPQLSGVVKVIRAQPNRVELEVTYIGENGVTLVGNDVDRLELIYLKPRYIISSGQTINLGSIFYFDHPAYGILATVSRINN